MSNGKRISLIPLLSILAGFTYAIGKTSAGDAVVIDGALAGNRIRSDTRTGVHTRVGGGRGCCLCRRFCRRFRGRGFSCWRSSGGLLSGYIRSRALDRKII